MKTEDMFVLRLALCEREDVSWLVEAVLDRLNSRARVSRNLIRGLSFMFDTSCACYSC